ncbi:MvdC/MvdD family ATP grasp protein [Acaryochloris sp. IP29b_bin.137]|uniref:MvdC/MvdD family ATP grasp protein n=1 Tax=Acaryochloris sp. IP29b_bin.137 TaxID=2969217 RepID=UPI00262424A8|nr:hypothetical protein [Acaryochloris sp. IP29b_bin.137]
MTASKAKVLILGHPQDAHVAHLRSALRHQGALVRCLETHQFPTQLRFSWHAKTQKGLIAWEPDDVWALEEIRRVFWRQISGVSIPPLADKQQQWIAYNDSMSLMRSLMQSHSPQWVNTWEAYQFHKEKPLQLSTVKQLGVQIPPTLVSNDPQQVIAFVKSLEQAIFKPVYGGAHAQWVTPEHLDPQRLQLALKVSPATFQAYIPGTNIRTYVIGESVFSAEIRSPSVDFRDDQTAELLPVTLPGAVQHQSLAITKALKLKWTAIDWRLTPTQDYFFLEANPSPMFIYFEQQTGYPITQTLVQLLLAD